MRVASRGAGCSQGRWKEMNPKPKIDPRFLEDELEGALDGIDRYSCMVRSALGGPLRTDQAIVIYAMQKLIAFTREAAALARDMIGEEKK